MTSTPSPHGVSFQHLRNWASARAHRNRHGHAQQSQHSQRTPTQIQTATTPIPARARELVAAASVRLREGDEEAEDRQGRREQSEDSDEDPNTENPERENSWHMPREEANDDDVTDEGEGEDELDEPAAEDDETEGVDHAEEEEEDVGVEEVPMDIDPPFDPHALGLKEIGSLASWTVSTCKPGCGVEALRDDDTNLFWQSDGPQPHHLNIHFSRLMSIRALRLFLDFEADESYTPTRITLLAGTGYHDLIPFSFLEFAQPKGWIDVPLDHVGGGPDGRTLRAFLVQVKVVENHQNGKDTHLRGLKIYVDDERGPRVAADGKGETEQVPSHDVVVGRTKRSEKAWLELDWMDEPQIR